jgi:hypothetical protein
MACKKVTIQQKGQVPIDWRVSKIHESTGDYMHMPLNWHFTCYQN